MNEGIIRPYLIGDAKVIRSILRRMGKTLLEDSIVPASDSSDAAEIAVRMVRDGEADFYEGIIGDI